MKSPFPGMNPYLEARWSNVHVLMVSAIAALLKPSLPPGLEARPEEEILIETIAGERMQGFRPDIAVVDSGNFPAEISESAAATAVAEPIRIAFHRGPIVLRNVQVVDTRDHDRVVTVIEVLSPWNKLPGRLNKDYIRKLKALDEGGANWVEIDLLRSTMSHVMVTWDDIRANHRSTYLVLTSNNHDQELLAYPFSLRQCLPKVRVPLRQNDPEVVLDLQLVLQRVYQDGPFESIDYSKPSEPPLSEADAAWAAEMTKK
jgi:hypothetical protein